MVQFPDSRSKGTSLINVHEGGKSNTGMLFAILNAPEREKERERVFGLVFYVHEASHEHESRRVG